MVLLVAGQCVLAKFAYEARAPDQISFQAGDSITVTSQLNHEWATGQVYSGPVGLFPIPVCGMLPAENMRFLSLLCGVYGMSFSLLCSLGYFSFPLSLFSVFPFSSRPLFFALILVSMLVLKHSSPSSILFSVSCAFSIVLVPL
jgi:Variant SH3 domain